jgi:very-short-patch-repair endonuclease
MGGQGRTVEALLAVLATGRKGVVTRRELLAAGLSAREIERRIENGSLIVEFRGVYRVGHRAPSAEAMYLAAVRACGDGALLSGRSAAYVLGLLKTRHPSPPEVTARTERRVAGIRVRRSPRICREYASRWSGIPVTTVPRTLVDLAGALHVDDLARACHEAGVLHRTSPSDVEQVLADQPNVVGARKLRKVLRGDGRVTLSVLERRFLKLLRANSLPLPETNRRVGTYRVDCRWPEHRLTVELDSYRYHASRHAWEQDRRREREARARGDEFRRYTYGDVFEAQGPMLTELRALLAHRPG